MCKNFSRGSEWRKWDLHIHTPASYDYKDKSVTNDKIIEVLSDNDVAVAAITDHHNIDIDRIKELQSMGSSKKITILPGIEFRSELGGSDSIHFVGIFSEDCQIDEIWTDIQSKCNLKPSQIAAVGNEKLYVDFRETAQLIHKFAYSAQTDHRFRSIVTTHSGGL